MMVGMRNFHKGKKVIPDSNFGCPKNKQACQEKLTADSLYYSEKIAYYN